MAELLESIVLQNSYSTGCSANPYYSLNCDYGLSVMFLLYYAMARKNLLPFGAISRRQGDGKQGKERGLVTIDYYLDERVPEHKPMGIYDVYWATLGLLKELVGIGQDAIEDLDDDTRSLSMEANRCLYPIVKSIVAISIGSGAALAFYYLVLDNLIK